ncbi:hypothetical protein L1787_08790 [Acuticoccus sp. M5D2P5]|uniref:hypothetical protein n=1 Tax=Acuticoccus kalidii TaxID=2910977 RepID=UPI001F485C77|nr:hypothetical protein [Acuticoccus kalidii]MCF3933506.1 hypothetical protein [Acuticoccus kalidii]
MAGPTTNETETGEPIAPQPDFLSAEASAQVGRRRRSRSIAIALVLIGMVVLFYVITIIQLGGSGGTHT